MHLVRAELLKVRSTRLWIGMLIGCLAFTALGAIVLLAVTNTAEGVAAGLQPIATVVDVRDFVIQVEGSVPFVLVLAATMATGEYRYGTAAGTYLATPSRARVIAGKASAAAIVGFAVGAVAAILALVIVAVGLPLQGASMPVGAAEFAVIGQIGLRGMYVALLGVGVGILLRSQLVAILSLLGWLLIVEPLVTSLMPKVARWSPLTGSAPAFGLGAEQSDILFGWAGALALGAACVAIVLTIATAIEQRRDS
jgi:ABC-type transport system involved in multi-copper enzyme maturation permease subunit